MKELVLPSRNRIAKKEDRALSEFFFGPDPSGCRIFPGTERAGTGIAD